MASDIFVNGETLVMVKGRSDSGIGTLSELGLSSDSIRITPQFRWLDVNADAWGQAPFEMQFMLASLSVTMTLVHFDRTVLNYCITESMAGAPAIGQLPRAGARMGNNTARFSTTNHFISLNLTSPVGGIPWRFYTSFLTVNPLEFPLGTERSLVTLNWRVIPFTTDPYNDGSGAQGTVLWDHVNDN